MSTQVNFDLVRWAFQKLPTHPVFGTRLLHRWLSAVICVRAIKISGYLDKDIANMPDTIKCNRAMSRSHIWGQLMEFFDGAQPYG